MKFNLILSCVALSGLAACATPSVQSPLVRGVAPPVGVNVSTPAQRIENPRRGTAADRTLTLQQLLDARAPGAGTDKEAEKVSAAGIRESALTYGTQAGLAWGTRQVQATLRGRATELGRTYDFNALIVRKDGVLWQPPVISEMGATRELADGGRTMRIADKVYEIVEPGYVVQEAKLWSAYLDQEACCGKFPELGDNLPKTDAEREIWKRYVSEGWNEGLTQATDTFQRNMAIMQRDFVGMSKYMQLAAENKMITPAFSVARMGTTGTGLTRRENDQVIRVTRDAKLRVDSPGDVRPTVSGRPTGQDAVQDGEAQPQPRTAEAARGGRIVPGSSPGRLVTPRVNRTQSTVGMPAFGQAAVGGTVDMPPTSTNRGY